MPDLADMSPVCLALVVPAQAHGWIRDTQLARCVLDDAGGHIRWVRQKRAEETDGAQLQGEAETGLVATTSTDGRAIRFVQVEVSSELFR
jgi:hypothetical protein